MNDAVLVAELKSRGCSCGWRRRHRRRRRSGRRLPWRRSGRRLSGGSGSGRLPSRRSGGRLRGGSGRLPSGRSGGRLRGGSGRLPGRRGGRRLRGGGGSGRLPGRRGGRRLRGGSRSLRGRRSGWRLSGGRRRGRLCCGRGWRRRSNRCLVASRPEVPSERDNNQRPENRPKPAHHGGPDRGCSELRSDSLVHSPRNCRAFMPLACQIYDPSIAGNKAFYSSRAREAGGHGHPRSQAPGFDC